MGNYVNFPGNPDYGPEIAAATTANLPLCVEALQRELVHEEFKHTPKPRKSILSS
jgi:hypothetical protein